MITKGRRNRARTDALKVYEREGKKTGIRMNKKNSLPCSLTYLCMYDVQPFNKTCCIIKKWNWWTKEITKKEIFDCRNYWWRLYRTRNLLFEGYITHLSLAHSQSSSFLFYIYIYLWSHRMMHTNTCEWAVIQMLFEMTPKEAFLPQLLFFFFLHHANDAWRLFLHRLWMIFFFSLKIL